MAQGQVLQGDMAVSAAEEGKQSKQAEQESNHRAGIFSGSAPPDQSLGAERSFGEGHVTEDAPGASVGVVPDGQGGVEVFGSDDGRAVEDGVDQRQAENVGVVRQNLVRVAWTASGELTFRRPEGEEKET